MIRQAIRNDISGVVKIYDKILDLETEGKAHTGWQKNIYPTEETALDALQKGDLFVFEEDGCILAAARINQKQEPEYEDCQWAFLAPNSEIMVLHTLVVDPDASGRGIGSEFVRFYEEFAVTNGCHFLRMDTNVINTAARALYKKHGYSEQGIVRCIFNGINDVQLVCLEKKLT